MTCPVSHSGVCPKKLKPSDLISVSDKGNASRTPDPRLGSAGQQGGWLRSFFDCSGSSDFMLPHGHVAVKCHQEDEGLSERPLVFPGSPRILLMCAGDTMGRSGTAHGQPTRLRPEAVG